MAAAPGSQTLNCADYINTQPPPADWEVVLGVVALTTAPNTPALQTSRSGVPNPAQRLFAKEGLLITAGSRFELVVPAALAGRLSIGWGSSAHPNREVIVKGCHPHGGGGSGWLAYAGGYFVPHPECVGLLVRTGNRQQRVRIGLGRPCPGQKPPQGPSES